MQIVYSRVSTASQSLLRQRHILTEAGLLVRTEGVAEGFHPADGVLLFEDPATTSKIPALDRPAFAKIAAKAHPGDTLTVSELFRLCRDLIDIHNEPRLVPSSRRHPTRPVRPAVELPTSTSGSAAASTWPPSSKN